jgi:hypothetical protein
MSHITAAACCSHNAKRLSNQESSNRNTDFLYAAPSHQKTGRLAMMTNSTTTLGTNRLLLGITRKPLLPPRALLSSVLSRPRRGAGCAE